MSKFQIQFVDKRAQKNMLSFLKSIPGEVVVIHSSLLNFGLPEGGIENLCNEIIESLGRNVTIIMPTFTFLIPENNTWDWHKTKSEMGAVTEFFRKEIADFRTLHPIHSVAISGPEAKELSKSISSSSFGPNSIWKELSIRNDVCNISFGIGMVGGATFLHYVEEQAKVHYRSYVPINRKVLDKEGIDVKEDFTYFAKMERNGKFAENSWEQVSQDLKREKLVETIHLTPEFQVSLMNVGVTCRYVGEEIAKNSNYLGGFVE